jgi:hypothetical protein
VVKAFDTGFMQPLLTNLKRGVPTFKEELLLVASFYKVENEQEL